MKVWRKSEPKHDSALLAWQSQGLLVVMSLWNEFSYRYIPAYDNVDVRKSLKAGISDTKVELHPNINVPCHLHDLREIHRLFRCFLQILNRENLSSQSC